MSEQKNGKKWYDSRLLNTAIIVFVTLGVNIYYANEHTFGTHVVLDDLINNANADLNEKIGLTNTNTNERFADHRLISNQTNNSIKNVDIKIDKIDGKVDANTSSIKNLDGKIDIILERLPEPQT